MTFWIVSIMMGWLGPGNDLELAAPWEDEKASYFMHDRYIRRVAFFPRVSGRAT